MAKTAKLTIQQWGNSLAVRIPKAIARSAHFAVGQPVELLVQDAGVMVKAVGEPKRTLVQKLALFDLTKHGGEAMASGLVGAEAL